MGIIYLLIVAFLGWVGVRIYKSYKSSQMTFDEHHFKQGDVDVIFATGIIKIRTTEYKVNQVTGIKAEPYTQSHRHGGSKAWKAIIELDDFRKPRYEMEFFSRKRANEFTQRLSVALRKAGGPSFS
ncbi:MAG: hypothetical protein JSS64_12140 [Bacteroidetes bacterium]|nr:hypothetical protein [Bacteroidota bacterium]